MEGVKILTLDDDKLFNKILSKFLTDLGFAHKVTDSIRDFAYQLGTEVYNLYLIDLNLVNTGEGFKIISKIRSTGNKTPILVISAQSDSSEISHAMEIGANDYLIKPLDKTVLGSKLKNYFSSRKLEQNALRLRQAPGQGIHAEIDFELQVKEMNEFGIKVVSKHLLLKDIPIKVNIGKVLWNDDLVINASVKKNWVIPQTDSFGARLEFDPEAKKALAKIRAWLMGKRGR